MISNDSFCVIGDFLEPKDIKNMITYSKNDNNKSLEINLKKLKNKKQFKKAKDNFYNTYGVLSDYLVKELNIDSTNKFIYYHINTEIMFPKMLDVLSKYDVEYCSKTFLNLYGIYVVSTSEYILARKLLKRKDFTKLKTKKMFNMIFYKTLKSIELNRYGRYYYVN